MNINHVGILNLAYFLRAFDKSPMIDLCPRLAALATVARTTEVVVATKRISRQDFASVIVGSTSQGRAIAHPSGSTVLESARTSIFENTWAVGIELVQSHAKKEVLQPKHRLRIMQPQSTIQSVLLCEIRRGLTPRATAKAAGVVRCDRQAETQADLKMWADRAGRLHTQQRNVKNKSFQLHALRLRLSRRMRGTR